MASNAKFSVDARNAALDAIMALWLPPTEFGFIELRTGAPAASPQAAPAGMCSRQPGIMLKHP